MSEKTVCPYFEDRFVEVVLPSSLTSRRVSAPVCGLAEIMLVRLQATEGGRQIAVLLTMTPDNAPPRSIYGCDLAPAERQSCTTERLHTRCEPGFIKFLYDQDLHADLPVVPLIMPDREA